MKKINTAYNQVRSELEELGLLYDGVYLDKIELQISRIPSLGEAGFVYDSGVPWYLGIFGYEAGVIYLPSDTPHDDYVPGGTLADTIRHEFAHAWAWLDREFINRPWFKKTFVRAYDDEWEIGKSLYHLFKEVPDEFEKSPYFLEYASPYAMSAPYEDFAETFMMCLRYRNSLQRFRRRPRLYKKITALRNAINCAGREI